MPDGSDGALLLYGDTTRSAALRHEVPLTIVDPFLFVETDGRRVVVIGDLEIPRVVLDVLRAHDADLDELIVSHGPQTAIGHEPGHGVVLPGEPIIVDIWPRDRASACHTDMTRTFVCGDPPARLVRLHELCLRAMDLALGLIAPGASTLAAYRAVCELFEEHGFWTPLAKGIERSDALSGFPYALGHGVGLELHEQPVLSRGGDATFVPGDVVAIEPALYVGGFGGCRLEDAVLVTEDGCKPLTSESYEVRC